MDSRLQTPTRTKPKTSKAQITIQGDRALKYRWEAVGGRADQLRLVGSDEVERIGDLVLHDALSELFDVAALQSDWIYREFKWDPNLIANDIGRALSEWRIDAEMLRKGQDLDHQRKVKAWVSRYIDRDRRKTARKKFGDAWADYSSTFGPIADDSRTFGFRVRDLHVLRQHINDQTIAADTFPVAHQEKLSRARLAAAQVREVAVDTWEAPDMFTALAFVIEHHDDFGISFRHCRYPECDRLFATNSTRKKYCSEDVCRMGHTRSSKQR